MSQALPFAQAGFTLATGAFGAKAKNTQAKELEYQAKIQNLQGRQTSVLHRERLNGALNTIEALKASRNVRESFGASARRQKNLSNADRNENTALLSSHLREDSLNRQAAGLRKSAKFSFLGSIFNAGSGLADRLKGP